MAETCKVCGDPATTGIVWHTTPEIAEAGREHFRVTQPRLSIRVQGNQMIIDDLCEGCKESLARVFDRNGYKRGKL